MCLNDSIAWGSVVKNETSAFWRARTQAATLAEYEKGWGRTSLFLICQARGEDRPVKRFWVTINFSEVIFHHDNQISNAITSRIVHTEIVHQIHDEDVP